MTSVDLKHCGKMPDAREELNISMREGRNNLDIPLRVCRGWDQVHMT